MCDIWVDAMLKREIGTSAYLFYSLYELHIGLFTSAKPFNDDMWRCDMYSPAMTLVLHMARWGSLERERQTTVVLSKTSIL